MEYTKQYNILIERARHRKLNSYTETHHIIPRCIGGTDDISNLVELTPEEHYVAHQFLVKMYPENKELIFAAHMMGSTRKGNKLYGWLRRKYARAKSESMVGKKPNNYGKPMPEEAKEKIRQANLGKKHTEETKEKMSIKKLGNTNGIGNKSRTGQTQSEEEREKKRISSTGRIHSEETKKYLSEIKKGIPKPKFECPHCNRLFSPTNLARYHGDKCKLK